MEDLGAKRPQIRPLGCRGMRAPTWRDPNARLGRLSAAADSAKGRVDLFHRHLLTADSMPVQQGERIIIVSTCRNERNELIFFLRDFCSTKVVLNFRMRATQKNQKSDCAGNRSARYAALFMPISARPLLLLACSFVLAATVRVDGSPAKSQFVFKDARGKTHAASVVSNYYPKKLVYPLAKIDRRLDPKLMRAATIAQERSRAHSHSRCWQYVKEALLASGAVGSYPKTAYAKDAGQELVNTYGFKKLAVRDPFKAPVGAVLVYGASRAAGHVEIRTKDGFVSDFRSKIPSPRPLIGVYAKL